MDLQRFFLDQKKALYLGTRDVFSRIPPEHLAWRPEAGMLALGDIVRHVWTSERGVRQLAFEDDWSYYEKRIPLGLEGILGEVTSLEEELEHLREQHETTLSRAERFPLDRWSEKRDSEKFGMHRRVHVLLFGINEHYVHHAAQAGVYIRLLTGQRTSRYAF